MKSIHALLLAFGLAVAPASAVLAQETTPDDPTISLDDGFEDPTIPLDEEPLEEEEMARFASRDLLTETFLADELAAQAEAEAAVVDAQTALDDALASQMLVTDLETAVNDAQAALDAAVASGTATPEEITALEDAVGAAQMELDQALADQATPEEIAALEAELTAAQTTLDGLQTEVDETTALIAGLSDEQVFALNRTLNNALASKLGLEYDAAMLQPILDNDYNRHQINAYTQGLEQEARFLDKADRFQARYDESGNEGFLSKVDRFTEWAAVQKDKFFGKIDRFDDKDGVGPHDAVDGSESDELSASAAAAARKAARDEAHETAGGVAKNAAKQAAKAAARDAAKQAAKDAASKEARRVARAAAKDAVKQAGKSAENKGKGKSKGS